jgi:hypothetical protein
VRLLRVIVLLLSSRTDPCRCPAAAAAAAAAAAVVDADLYSDVGDKVSGGCCNAFGTMLHNYVAQRDDVTVFNLAPPTWLHQPDGIDLPL